MGFPLLLCAKNFIELGICFFVLCACLLLAKDSPDYVEPQIPADAGVVAVSPTPAAAAATRPASSHTSPVAGLPPPPSLPPPPLHVHANTPHLQPNAARGEPSMVSALPMSTHMPRHPPPPMAYAESVSSRRSSYSGQQQRVGSPLLRLRSMAAGSMPAAGDSGHSSLVASPAPSPSSTMHTALSAAAARGGHRSSLSSQDLALHRSARGTPSPDRGSSTSSAVSGQKRSLQQLSSIREGSTGSDRGVGGGSDSESGEPIKRQRLSSSSPTGSPPHVSPRGGPEDFRCRSTSSRMQNLSDAQNASLVREAHYNGHISTSSMRGATFSTRRGMPSTDAVLQARQLLNAGITRRTPTANHAGQHDPFQTFLMTSSAATYPTSASSPSGVDSVSSRRRESLMNIHHHQQRTHELGGGNSHRPTSPTIRSSEAAAAASHAAASTSHHRTHTSSMGSGSPFPNMVKTEFGNEVRREARVPSRRSADFMCLSSVIIQVIIKCYYCQGFISYALTMLHKHSFKIVRSMRLGKYAAQDFVGKPRYDTIPSFVSIACT